ncbi:unnamed protein product [Allacma fusca]|uniref:Uncharacterized protein n=1 Tax=Allacma fusca TaxID=39272 RepID=A0A8J2P7F4_9HEXA|nr:unnamed protein product [Allacma fusca]
MGNGRTSSYAQRALELNEDSADAHKWLAISTGSRGEFLKINEKIQNGYLFKEHIDRAVQINPADASLYHLLGRFCFEVSQLSWVERRVASTLFSEPPSSTVEEALQHFLSAENKGKPFIENRLFISKCYISLSDYPKAAHWLTLASQLSAMTSNDEKAQVEVLELLPKYRNRSDGVGHREQDGAINSPLLIGAGKYRIGIGDLNKER